MDKKHLIVALDVATKEEALSLIQQLHRHVGMFKVGLELISSGDAAAVEQRIVEVGSQVFHDGKLGDIPHTAASAARALVRAGRARMFTIHTTFGLAMMKGVIDAVKEETAAQRPLVLGVTILTSLNQYTMNYEVGLPDTIDNQVVRLAKLAVSAGLDGVVASGHEIELLRREVSREMLIVTPGVRPWEAGINDQKRVMTPTEAIRKGASHIVVGRPIAYAEDPVAAAIQLWKR